MDIPTFSLIHAALLGAFEIVNLLNIAIVALGLGLVIFFHELGHFAVAKWCNVKVERFSIGFGPILLSRTWGETEYALSAVPFGGYVKMLGQDDVDPGQMTSDSVAEDPRSYTSKSVPQRMAIISAGVIMNVITGLLFFVFAFRSGIEVSDPVLGFVQVGMPAWTAGIEAGDKITSINDRPIDDFEGIMRGTALTRGPIHLEVESVDGRTYRVEMQPDTSGSRRLIGVGRGYNLTVVEPPDPKRYPAALPGTPAALSQNGFQPGDVVQQVDGAAVESFAELSDILAERRSEPITFTVHRQAADKSVQSVDITVPPAHFRTLGLRIDMGLVKAIRRNSPAQAAGLKIGDKITSVDGLDVGKDIDPLHLPDYFGERHGEPVQLTYQREREGGPPEATQITVVPDDRPGWTEPPLFEKSPLSIPSLGLAYQLTPTVHAVDPDGPAAKSGIKANDVIRKIELVPRDQTADGLDPKVHSVNIGAGNWAYAFWLLQQEAATREVRVTVQRGDSEETETLVVVPQQAEDWYLPTTRGLRFSYASQERQADSIPAALAMSWNHTRDSILDIYLTLRNLIMQDLSVKELHGPIKIAQIAYAVAEAGLPQFLTFLGFLSINLAVINFLPIPVLDGGHMVFLLWEGIARRKPSERIVAAATYCGLAFVLCLMVFVIYMDLFGKHS